MAPPHGMLFVATDADPHHEADFNKWYDEEHVEERARIAGFISAARYQAIDGSRKYLGLYLTDSLQVFTSAAYKAVFGRQTAWSVVNLDRMIDPMRRVGAVCSVVGQGSGSRVSVITLPLTEDADALQDQAEEAGALLSPIPGFVQSYLLLPDAALSTPLPREKKEGRVFAPLLLLETSNTEANRQVVAEALSFFKGDIDKVAQYELGWKIFSSEFAK